VDGDRGVGDLEVATPISTTHHTGAICLITRPAAECHGAEGASPVPVRCHGPRSNLDLELETLVRPEPGTLPWLLARDRAAIFPEWLTDAWPRGKGRRGRNAWPVQCLLSLFLLRWSEGGTSRNGSCKRARTDLLWRYAIGLGIEDGTPSEKSIRELEAWLREEHENTGMTRMELLFEHVLQLARWSEITRGRHAPRWVMDSTPMWCFGAVLDTVRLLGDGLRRLGTSWARETRATVATVAHDWKLPILTARSAKGHFRADWRDADARSDVISELVDDTLRVVELVRAGIDRVKSPWRRQQQLGLCDTLLRVIEQDLEQDRRGRWRVAKRVAAGRLVSLTDPEARHGHKTRSELFWGFKIHVLGDALSGIIASLLVTPGNSHDGEPGHALVARVRQMRIELKRLFADTAYGGAESRMKLRAIGIELIAPPPGASPSAGETPSKNEFAIDFDRMRATCPNGVETDQTEHTRGKVKNLAFRWPIEACARCPLQAKCLDTPLPPDYGTVARPGRPRAGKRLVLDPFERERREARAWWADPQVRELYRQRSPGERLHTELLRHGARQARSRGLAAAQLQVDAIGLVVNLGILARNIAALRGESESAKTRRRRRSRRTALAQAA
jgi:hypothetical protein